MLPGLCVSLHRARGANIGERVYIGTEVRIDLIFPNLITLDDEVTISDRVYILAHSKPNLYQKDVLDSYASPVKIGKGAFIGVSAIILAGVLIGKGSIVVKNGEFLKTEFSNNEGKKIQISLKMQIKDDIEQNVAKDNMESYSKKILQMLDSDLFDIIEL